MSVRSSETESEDASIYVAKMRKKGEEYKATIEESVKGYKEDSKEIRCKKGKS